MEESRQHRKNVSRTINIYRAQSMALKLLDNSKRLYTILTAEEAYFIWVSQSWLNYLGWTFDELTTVPFTDLIHPDDMESSLKVWERFQRTGQLSFDSLEFTNRYRTKQGFYKEIIWQYVMETEGGYYMMEATTPDNNA